MKNEMKEVEAHYNKAFEVAIAYVEKEARSIMRKKKNLKEFIMAMGTYFFVDKNGNNVDTHEEVYRNYRYHYQDAAPCFKDLNDFITEWDKYLRLTGWAMRFTADGPVVTDW